MLRGETPDAAILDQAGERPVQGPVSIRCFGVIVDFRASGHRLGRGTMNLTAIPDLAVYMARAIVADEAQRLPSPPMQCQTAREVLVVIQVPPEVDPEDGTAFGLGGEFLLSMSTGLLAPAAPGFVTRFNADRRPSSASFDISVSIIAPLPSSRMAVAVWRRRQGRRAW